jgi:hypothetical protein
MSMDVDEAICIVLTLQHRPQTSMTGELRTIYQRALRVVDTCAQRRIDFERRPAPPADVGSLTEKGKSNGDF